MLIFAHSFAQFELTWWIGLFSFDMLANTTLLYFILYLIFREKLKKASFFVFPLCYLTSLMFFFFVTLSQLGVVLYYTYFFPFCMYFWFIITAIFSMNGKYNKAMDLDDKFEKSSKFNGTSLRWGLFIGGAIVANYLIYFAATYILFYMSSSPSIDLEFTVELLSWGMYIAIWALFGIGVIFLFLKKKLLWLGTFIVLITIFAINLMVKAGQLEKGPGSSSEFLPLQIIQYFYGLYLLLVSVAKLIGEKSKTLARGGQGFIYEIILLWLIISMALYNAGSLSIIYQAGEFWVELEVLSIIIPIFAGIFGIYGMIRYYKKKEQVIE